MVTAVFCSEDYIKSYTPISANVDVSMIWPFIVTFQDTNIQDILGSKLYTTLQTKVSGADTTADEVALLDLCRSAIAWGAFNQCIPFIAIQVRNKSVMENSAEFSSNPDLEKIRWMKGKAEEMSEFYMKRLADYLCKHGRLFTDYTHPDNPLTPSYRNPATDCDLYLGPSSDTNWRETEFYKRYIK